MDKSDELNKKIQEIQEKSNEKTAQLQNEMQKFIEVKEKEINDEARQCQEQIEALKEGSTSCDPPKLKRARYSIGDVFVDHITCSAAVARNTDQKLSIEQIIVSPPSDGEVRIQMKYSLIAPSDIRAWKDSSTKFPIIFGSGGTGIVEAVGLRVKDISKGDQVLIAPIFHRLRCAECLGNLNVCSAWKNYCMSESTRFKSDGKVINRYLGISSFSQFVVVDESLVFKLKPEIPLERACFVSDIGLVYSASKNIVTKESNVGIWGLNKNGLAIALGCKSKGIDKIAVFHFDELALKNAKEFGITHCFSAKDIGEYISQLQSAHVGFDYTFNTLKSEESLVQAVKFTKPGGKICIFGVPGKMTMNVNDFVGRTIQEFPYDISSLLDCIMSEDLDKLVGMQFKLSEINEAFMFVKRIPYKSYIIRMDGDDLKNKDDE